LRFVVASAGGDSVGVGAMPCSMCVDGMEEDRMVEGEGEGEHYRCARRGNITLATIARAGIGTLPGMSAFPLSGLAARSARETKAMTGAAHAKGQPPVRSIFQWDNALPAHTLRYAPNIVVSCRGVACCRRVWAMTMADGFHSSIHARACTGSPHATLAAALRYGLRAIAKAPPPAPTSARPACKLRKAGG